jgi:hypothetical protein
MDQRVPLWRLLLQVLREVRSVTPREALLTGCGMVAAYTFKHFGGGGLSESVYQPATQ